MASRDASPSDRHRSKVGTDQTSVLDTGLTVNLPFTRAVGCS